MSDYYGIWRSNAFGVRDMDAFKAWVAAWPDAHCRQVKDGKVMLLKSHVSTWGGIPAYKNGEENADFLKELAQHIEEQTVCLIRVVGHGENLTFLDGTTHAIMGGDTPADMRIIDLRLADMEKIAKKTFALPVEPFNP